MSYIRINGKTRGSISTHSSNHVVSVVERPIEVIKEVFVDRPVEVLSKPVIIKEEQIVYVDKPVPYEVIKEVMVDRPVEKIKEVEVIREVIRIVERDKPVKYIPKAMYLLVVAELVVIISLLLNK